MYTHAAFRSTAVTAAGEVANKSFFDDLEFWDQFI